MVLPSSSLENPGTQSQLPGILWKKQDDWLFTTPQITLGLEELQVSNRFPTGQYLSARMPTLSLIWSNLHNKEHLDVIRPILKDTVFT